MLIALTWKEVSDGLQQVSRCQGRKQQQQDDRVGRAPHSEVDHSLHTRPSSVPLIAFDVESSYPVDPASSHMLVLKTEPCRPSIHLFIGETANH